MEIPIGKDGALVDKNSFVNYLLSLNQIFWFNNCLLARDIVEYKW